MNRPLPSSPHWVPTITAPGTKRSAHCSGSRWGNGTRRLVVAPKLAGRSVDGPEESRAALVDEEHPERGASRPATVTFGAAPPMRSL